MNNISLFSYGRTLTTNRRPLAGSVDVHYRAVNQLFYVGLDRFAVRDVVLSVFGGSIVTIRMGMEYTFSSRRFDLFGPSLVVVCVLKHKCWKTHYIYSVLIH